MSTMSHLKSRPHDQRFLRAQVNLDGGLAACLPKWPALTYLSLSSTDAGDDVFTKLPVLKSLCVLAATQTAVTGAGESLWPIASCSLANAPLLFYGETSEIDNLKGCHNNFTQFTCFISYSSPST